jgi:sugar phosphate isomerase/epimerase
VARPITLFTGQWADLPIEKLAPLAKEMGYDGLELACWGDHFEVVRALSEDGYDGPLSVEWEDAGMDRVHGARESAAFVRRLDFEPAAAAFDAAFGRE